jgi:hypothetical protein
MRARDTREDLAESCIAQRRKIEEGFQFLVDVVERGQPAAMPLKGLVKGWQEALQLMRPGDEWILYVPPELGYGAEGGGPMRGLSTPRGRSVAAECDPGGLRATEDAAVGSADRSDRRMGRGSVRRDTGRQRRGRR